MSEMKINFDEGFIQVGKAIEKLTDLTSVRVNAYCTTTSEIGLTKIA